MWEIAPNTFSPNIFISSDCYMGEISLKIK